MTDMEMATIRALAAIDDALGMPQDGCNSTEATLTAIALLHSVIRDDIAEIERLEAHLVEAHCMQQCACAFDAPEHICDYHRGLIDAAKRPLLARIKELEQRGEPVAWMHKIDLCDKKGRIGFEVYYKKTPGFCIPLYLSAPSPEDK